MADFAAGKYRLPLGEKAYVMGILNVTPDSFSDGGQYNTPEKALRRALEMQELGADLIDIGAQSTRPGHVQISPEEELSRLAPVLKLLEGRLSVPVSVDTFYPEVAEMALKNGVSIMNDVTGFENDEMIRVASKSDCGCIVMDAIGLRNSDILSDIRAFFEQKVRELNQAGIASERICLDPGIGSGVGFGKTNEQSLTILANCARLRVGACALMVAASRKGFIGAECGGVPAEQRMPGTVAAHSIAIADGADFIRAHDVAEAVQSAKIASAIRRYRIGSNHD